MGAQDKSQSQGSDKTRQNWTGFLLVRGPMKLLALAALATSGVYWFLILDYLCYKTRSWHPSPINYRKNCITDKGCQCENIFPRGCNRRLSGDKSPQINTHVLKIGKSTGAICPSLSSFVRVFVRGKRSHKRQAQSECCWDRYWSFRTSSCVSLLRQQRKMSVVSAVLLQTSEAMADWLISCGVETVAMESTSVDWIPVFQMLEARGLEVFLVNAHHVKTVPGLVSRSFRHRYYLDISVLILILRS